MESSNATIIVYDAVNSTHEDSNVFLDASDVCAFTNIALENNVNIKINKRKQNLVENKSRKESVENECVTDNSNENLTEDSNNYEFSWQPDESQQDGQIEFPLAIQMMTAVEDGFIENKEEIYSNTISYDSFMQIPEGELVANTSECSQNVFENTVAHEDDDRYVNYVEMQQDIVKGDTEGQEMLAEVKQENIEVNESEILTEINEENLNIQGNESFIVLKQDNLNMEEGDNFVVFNEENVTENVDSFVILNEDNLQTEQINNFVVMNQDYSESNSTDFTNVQENISSNEIFIENCDKNDNNGIAEGEFVMEFDNEDSDNAVCSESISDDIQDEQHNSTALHFHEHFLLSNDESTNKNESSASQNSLKLSNLAQITESTYSKLKSRSTPAMLVRSKRELSILPASTISIHKLVKKSPYACDLCSAEFQCAPYYEKHMEIMHSQTTLRKSMPLQPRFFCHSCQRTFLLAENLKRHIKLCEKLKELQCRQEAEQKSVPSGSSTVVTKADVKNFPCITCGWVASTATALQYHFMTKHYNNIKNKIASIKSSEQVTKYVPPQSHEEATNKLVLNLPKLSDAGDVAQVLGNSISEVKSENYKRNSSEIDSQVHKKIKISNVSKRTIKKKGTCKKVLRQRAQRSYKESSSTDESDDSS